VGAACLAIGTALALAACSGASPSTDEVETLAETKPPVQLLRNNVAGHIEHDATEGVTKVEDSSVACDDPDGLIRMWRSTALLELVADHAENVTATARAMGAELVDHDWTAVETAVSGSALTLELTNPSSRALIRITANEDADGDGRGATIFVVVTGPCVTTDGPGSDELAELGE
jgi:hypothetical protein